MESLSVPPLGSIMAYRGVYALATINQDGRLRATHYATCLVGGREPWWGVWTVYGNFQRFFGSREQIQQAYPKQVWRRKNATWSMVDVNDMDARAKREALTKIFRKGETTHPVAALFDNGTLVEWGKHEGMPGSFRPLYAGPVVEPTFEQELEKQIA